MTTRIEDVTSEKHRAQMELLGDILGLDRVRYEDLHNGENYRLERNGRIVTLRVRGNRDQGGFLCVVSDDPAQPA
jgi:hypothetical protein